MRKQNIDTMPDISTVIKQATDLSFASLFLPMSEVIQTIDALKKHPERASAIKSCLDKKMAREMPKYKEARTLQILKEEAMNRIGEWMKAIGEPTIQQYVALSKFWGLPVGEVASEKVSTKFIYDLLDCFVVGQENYKRQLSTSFFLHNLKSNESVNSLDLPKNNLLVCGPSGSGKTYGVQTLAKHFGIPIIIVHCNTLVPEGIVGDSFQDYFTTAYCALDALEERKKLNMLEHSIVCFDEYDKIFESGFDAVRNEILSLIDDNGEVRFRKTFCNTSERITIPTKNMMFVFTGVFQGLGERKTMGFVSANNANNPQPITPFDLIEFGIKPEIVGRIQNYAFLDKLSAEQLYEVLDSKAESPLNSFRNYFLLNEMTMTITDDAKRLLAEMACERGLGVRGMKNILNTILSDEMYQLSGNNILINCEFIKKHIN